MRTVRIGSVVEPVASWRPRDAADGEFRYIDLGAVDQDLKTVTGDRVLRAEAAPSRARQLVRAGDVLVANVRPNLNGVALVPARLHGAVASTGFCVLRPGAGLDSRYLFHWARSAGFVAELTRRATGQAYPAVTDRVVKDTRMPLPGLPEQRRAADVLDRVDALRDRRRTALADLRSLTAAVVEPLGAAGTEHTVGELCAVRGGKRLPRGARYAPAPTPFRYLRVADLRDDGIAEGNLRHLDAETHRAIARHTVAAGDVVLSIAGTVGLVAVVPPSVAGANLTENAARLTPREVDPRLLAHLLRTEGVQEQIRTRTGRATIGKLALFRVEGLRLRLPAPPARAEMARRLAAADRVRDLQLQSLAALGELAAAMRARVF